MQYLTYEEYGDDTLQDEEFAALEFKARKKIDFWTDCRVQKMAEVPEAVKHCMASLMRLEQRLGVDAQAANPVVASFNTDGYSESYGSASEQAAAADAAAAKAIRQWLYGETDDNGVPLLYRGVYL